MLSTPPEITASGKELLIKALSGEKIVFTRFKIGNGELSENENGSQLKDIINPLVEFPITEIDASDKGYVRITGSFNSASVKNDFFWRELGLFCKEESKEECLYAYANERENAGMLKANASDVVSEQTVTLIVAVGDAENVSAIIGEGAIYATKEALDEHKRNFKNPHGVSAEQIGLGNVQNVSPSDAVVEYTSATEISEPIVGEKASVFYGKVKKAIHDLIVHLKASNPHGITPTKIKAASEKHTHGASDITSGILGPARGGTGADSLSALSSKLAPYLSTPVFGVYTGDGEAKRLISLGFTPSAVIVCNSKGQMGQEVTNDSFWYGGICIGTHSVNLGYTFLPPRGAHDDTRWADDSTILMITDGGFYVNYYDKLQSHRIRTNSNGETYRYIAFR